MAGSHAFSNARPPIRRFLVVLVACLGLLSWCREASCVMLLIEGRDCLREHVEAGEAVTGSFVVLDVDSAWMNEAGTIDFEIIGPHNLKVFSVSRKAEDNFQFRAMYSGEYSFCMENKDHMAATVQLNYHVGHAAAAGNDMQNLAKDEHMTAVIQQLSAIQASLVLVQQDQAYFQARDLRRKKTNESTRQRVFWYAVLEVVVLSLASGLQVLILHYLFNKSTKKNRN
eukprot:TRINITY_DN8068_c0_g1_i1.p1 TRINITY_DN8068_c0_g1~~TRINITY_DN8068_c0_g1_i1.p1  ORF type:complete len:257 (-),score=24.02 TRINITY_DN8068_c0_g1_i1:65-745(-)